MKNKNLTIVLLTLLTITFLTSCKDPGTSIVKLRGDETNLPEELKGLKIYYVVTEDGGSVKVGLLKNKINSLTYKKGKHDESIILVNQETGQTYNVSSILVENDSIIVARK